MAKRNDLIVKLIGWLVVVLVVAVPVALLGLREPIITVTAMTVERGAVEQTVTSIAAGTVMPAQDSMVASGFVGTVEKLHFKEGDGVNAGDVMIELKHDDLDAQLALAEANHRVAESKLEQAKIAATIYGEIARARVSQTAAQQEQAESDFKRIKALASQRAISDSELQRTDVLLRVAQENAASAAASEKETLVRAEEIRSAGAMIEQAQSSIDTARATREKAFVRAPYAGVIADIFTDIGEAVNMGLPLLRLVQRDPVYVEAPFDESNAALIKLGQRARVNIDAYRGIDFLGTLDYIPPVVTINPDLSRTLAIRIKIDKEFLEKFLPGMSADVTILIDKKESVVNVPSESLVREEFAYVIEGDRTFRRKVTLGIGNWRSKEVLYGIKEGDSIVSSVTVPGLTDGVKIIVVPSLDVQ